MGEEIQIIVIRRPHRAPVPDPQELVRLFTGMMPEATASRLPPDWGQRYGRRPGRRKSTWYLYALAAAGCAALMIGSLVFASL